MMEPMEKTQSMEVEEERRTKKRFKTLKGSKLSYQRPDLVFSSILPRSLSLQALPKKLSHNGDSGSNDLLLYVWPLLWRHGHCHHRPLSPQPSLISEL